MDVENGNVISESPNDSDALVFLDIGCKKKTYLLEKNKNENGNDDSQSILRKVSGAVRPGRLTFILGPSGAGKTTLLNILAKRKKIGVTGCLYGAGRNTVHVSQHSTLINNLTARETLTFAAAIRLPNETKKKRNNYIDCVAKQLGICDTLNTKAGNLSGGERKRLTIACELLNDPEILLLDEPTSGLDSVSSASVVEALRAVAKSGRRVACVIHQPSSKLYALADDLLVLATGRTLYAGAISDVPDALGRAGFVCPQFYNMADYLLEIATGEHEGDRDLMERDARSYAFQMKKTEQSDINVNQRKDFPIEAEALISANEFQVVGYKANMWQQLTSLLWRCSIVSFRDVHLAQIRVAAHLIVALLLGVLYSGAGAEGSRVITNTACLFFFLLFLFFSNAMPTIHTFPVEATVVIEQHLNKWYSLITYCASKILMDLPLQLFCATVFVIPAWYMTSQPMDGFRLGLAWLICVLTTILAQSFGLVIGTAFDMKLGLFVVPAANIPMLMFSEFFIPYKEMPTYIRPIAAISYFRYAFDAILETAYGFNRDKLPCNGMFCLFSSPLDYLEYLGLARDIPKDIIILVVWIILLQISFFCVLAFRVYRTCR